MSAVVMEKCSLGEEAFGRSSSLRLEHYLRPQALTTWAGKLGGSGEPPLPSPIPSEVRAIDLNRPIAASATPRLVKQILLRVPAVFAEIGFGELAKPLRAHLPSTRKIMLPQHALDPDIDRKCSQPLIPKKHHAICNLRPHAWQRAQLFSELGIGQRRPSLEIRLAGADEPRRRTQVFGTIAELAFE